MHYVNPQVFCIASTKINYNELDSMLEAVGLQNKWETDSSSDGDTLAEVAGRLCYKSFEVGLNPNVTKIREGNKNYIGNVLKQGHGSVLEHTHCTFAMIGVSRVFTHELCRHRLANISQESLRYVRLTDLGAYYPQSFDDIEDETTRNKANDIFNKAFEQDEENITELSKLFNLEDEANFSAKKKLTSAMRRLAPMGLTTNIIFTSNQRNFRHMIGLRTSSGAEEEIRQVFALIAETLENMYPSMYQDMKPRPGDFGFPEYFFANEKV